MCKTKSKYESTAIRYIMMITLTSRIPNDNHKIKMIKFNYSFLITDWNQTE